jgi:hypothetical protein
MRSTRSRSASCWARQRGATGKTRANYRAFLLPRNEQPRVYTGADVTPESIWLPALPPTAPPTAKVAPARTASVPAPGGDSLRPVTIELGDLRGKQAKLVLVDDSKTSHLNIDDVWLWR